MPVKSPAQKRLMEAAAHTPGGFGGVSQAAARKFLSDSDGQGVRAAGVLYQAGDGRVLMLRRAGDSDHVGEWALPGGRIEDDETPEEAAARECREEMGDDVPIGELVPWVRDVRDNVEYTTFYCRVKQPFVPALNDEHDDYVWAGPSELIGP